MVFIANALGKFMRPARGTAAILGLLGRPNFWKGRSGLSDSGLEEWLQSCLRESIVALIPVMQFIPLLY
jgi:hypothetical protein